MPIGNLIEFVAGTKAKSQEVNYNFNLIKAFIDGLELTLSDITNSISQLEQQKANINGDYRIRFSVADALNSYDAVNLQTLNNRISNAVHIISGLSITRVGNNTILVSAGTCYESTYTKVLSLSNEVSKTNTNQAASTTYYVYIIGTAELSTDILISQQSINPALPTDYVYYRRIGLYTTDSSNNINSVSDEQIGQSGNGGGFISQNAEALASAIGPNFNKKYNVSVGWVATASGWLYCEGASSAGATTKVNIDGQRVFCNHQNRSDGRAGYFSIGSMAFIRKGQTITREDNGELKLVFIPVGAS